MLTHSILKRGTAIAQLFAYFRFTLQCEQGMRESMVADDVASPDDLANNLRTLPNIAPNQKKSCGHAVLRQDFEQMERMRVVWPVIVSEGELLRARSEAGEGTSVPLSGGRHGLVEQWAQRGRSGRSREHGSEHVRDCSGLIN